MSHIDTIRTVLDSRGISWVQLGALLGLAPNDFYDLATHEGHIWHASVGTLLRLAVALDLTPLQLLPETAYVKGQGYTATPPHAGGFGLAHDLNALIADHQEIADAIGCSETVLAWWLESDYYFTEMPLSVLNSLCTYLEISIAEVLTTFWHGIGRTME